MNKRLVILFCILAVLLLSGCTEEDWKNIICSQTDKTFWEKIYCFGWEPPQTTDDGGGPPNCNERQTERDGSCLCKPKYPVQVGVQCFTVQEHIENQGDPKSCGDLKSSEDRRLCFGKLAQPSDCKLAAGGGFKFNQVTNDCYFVTAKKPDDCTQILEMPLAAECYANVYPEGEDPNEYCESVSVVAFQQDACKKNLGV